MKPKSIFRFENYGAKTADKEECEEQLLAEYATLLGFYVATSVVLTAIAAEQDRLPRKFGQLDLALLGIATHKLSRIVAKDRITAILRAPFVNYIPAPVRAKWKRNHAAVDFNAASAIWFRARIAWLLGVPPLWVSASSLRHV
jgi:hypothetical protein